MSVFFENLRKAREIRGLSQGDLAKKAKLLPSVISLFENNKRKPSFDNLKNLADALDVSTDYLIGRVNELNESVNSTSDVLHRNLHQVQNDDNRAILQSFIDMLIDREKNKKISDE
ncbi:MAG: helix-turn-helix transcriptional regulator [Gammaproteobacteria bacterium]|nr:helix-turn-helix transcriptional regulator [Gammaproteobacteria bacterium]